MENETNTAQSRAGDSCRKRISFDCKMWFPFFLLIFKTDIERFCFYLQDTLLRDECHNNNCNNYRWLACAYIFNQVDLTIHASLRL